MAAVSSSAAQNSSDSWDQPPVSSSSRRALVAAAPIRDDWEDDDDDEPENEPDNQRIWDNANTKAPNPMPSLIISPSAASTRAVLSPPAGAFQHTMRILKRPSNSSSSSTMPPTSTASSETLKEREARYQAARERIFGEDDHEGDGRPLSLSPKEQQERERPASSTVAVVRNPRGPAGDTTGNTSPRGFEGSRVKPPLSQRQGPLP